MADVSGGRPVPGAAYLNILSLPRSHCRYLGPLTSSVRLTRARGVDGHWSARSYGVARKWEGSRKNGMGARWRHFHRRQSRSVVRRYLTPPKKAPPLAKVPCLASSVQAVAGGRSHRTVVRRCSSSRFASRNARARVGAIASSHADEPGSICPGLRVQILETDSDAVYPDSRLPPDQYWRLGWSCAALTRGEIIFADRGCENESSEFSRWWRN